MNDIISPENLVYSKPELLNDNHMHYCAGCSHGMVHKLVAEVIAEMGMQEKTVGVSPVGCAVFAYNYIDIDWHEAAHGRAPALATAIKRLWPDRLVFTYQGDGDMACIGTAESIHALNRGENITLIFINNAIYGMTGGQYSPTTPHGEKGTTAPYGNIDYNFDIPKLAEAAGATYTARGSAFHVPQMIRLIENGIKHKGFSMIEGLSVCPTYYGRKNKKGSAVDMYNWQKDHCIDIAKAAKMTPEELEGKVIIGEMSRCEKPEYTDMYMEIIHKCGGDEE